MAILLMSLAVATACNDKPKTDTIIVKKPTVKPAKAVQSMGDNNQSRDVKWLGATYHVQVERKADRSLPFAVDEQGNKFYDNRITVIITRPDGSEFFNRTFSKADFDKWIGEDTRKNGALLGIVFDDTKGESLRFAASVGSPDRMSDEYVPLVVEISRTGGVSISQDTQLDTTSSDSGDEEDDGV